MSLEPSRFVFRSLLAVAILSFTFASLMPPDAAAADPNSAAETTEKMTTKKAGGEAKTAEPGSDAAPTSDPLAHPEQANEKAPAVFRVAFETTKGQIVVEVQRAWAPNGADRFYNLVTMGFYDDIALFRVIDGFMAQFGIHGTPSINRAWQRAVIKDDPVVESNLRGMLSFAKTNRPNSRTTQVFINFSDNVNLDGMGFAPFARVVEGMDVVDKIYKVGEGRPRGKGPSQRRIQVGGNDYLKKKFPELDYIRGARVLD